MPELPEVETTRRGIAPHITGHTVEDVVLRQTKLRWPVPRTLKQKLHGLSINEVKRRGKYLLLETDAGTVIMHLGMSGRIRILQQAQAPEKHDHLDICFSDGSILRFTDPRRFGAVLWTSHNPLQHKLLSNLGPEPLSDEFHAEYLYTCSRKRSAAIKTFIMDSRIVVGVGNIYANESLFRASIHPTRAAGRISLERYEQLVAAIKQVLTEAIAAGGTTLRDFTNGAGKPGYFRHNLEVYGRGGESCVNCDTTLLETRLGQRSTVYCPACQR